MRDQTLLYSLTNTPTSQKIVFPILLEPIPSAIFLESGHVMEFIEVGPDIKKMVTLFFGPGEFIIPCHPALSHIIALDDVKTTPFSFSLIFKTLRKFPEAHMHYARIRQLYHEKIADRLNLSNLPIMERVKQLITKQPWVMSLVNKADIASYLGISESTLSQIA